MLKLLLATVIGLCPLLGFYLGGLFFPKGFHSEIDKPLFVLAIGWGVYLFIVNMK